jgi:outer membrane protein assembly factor BamB
MNAPRRRRFLGGGVTGLLAATAGCQSLRGVNSSAGGATWPTTGFDRANTGFAPDRIAVPGAGSVRWQLPENDVPVAADGTVFQRASAWNDAGDYDWRSGTTAATQSMPAPTYHDDVLYVLDGIPAAYDADDGSGRWRQADVAGCVGAPRLTEDGVFGVTTGRNYARDVPTVFRLHAGNGGVDWRTDLPVDPSYTPVVADETVVTAGERRSPDGGVVAAHSASGAERWRVELEGLLWAEPTIGDGAVFVATRDGTVTALDLDTGDVRWQRTFASAPRRFCYGEGQLYAFTGVLRGLSAASGRTAWRTNLGGDPVGVDAEAIYCVGGRGLSADRYLRVVDRETRTQRWHYEFPEVLRGDIQTGGIVGRPALVDGAVFVAAADGLYAFEADSPLDV